jgi:serpin B
MKTVLRCRRALPPALFVTIAALMLALSACAGTGGPDDTQAPDTTAAQTDTLRLAMSDVSRLPATAPAADVEAVVESARRFSYDLYALLAQEAGAGNLVFSPTSITTALAMTYAGAAGLTADEMAATLHFTLQGEGLHQAFNSLDVALESRNFEESGPEGKKQGVVLRTANSLWAQQDLTFEQPFLDTLAANYGAGVRLVDYKTATETARQAINQWVAGETNDKIPELIAQGVLNAMTRLTLVNAVYMDATWASRFTPEATADGVFTTLEGSQVTIPMMSQTETFLYAAGDDWQAVELPYLGNQLAMFLIVPEAGRFAEVESRLGTGLLGEAYDSLSPGYEVGLTMPKFEFRTQVALSDALRTLGMTTPFDPGTADFSGMTLEEALFVSDVIHEAYIKVDEEGTEAAAATAVIMEATAAPVGEFVSLTVDRPFLFVIGDLETKTILFLGRVTDPTP